MAEPVKEKIDITDVDFDSIDLGDDLELDVDEASLASFGEVDVEIHEPHVKVSTKSFAEALKMAKLVAQVSGRDVIAKSLLFEYDNGMIVVKATDSETYLTYKMECLNSENVLKEPFTIPIDTLLKVFKALPLNTAFIKRDDQIYIKLFGGDLPLETFSVDPEKYYFTEELEKVHTINAATLHSIVKDLSPLVCAAVNPTERRIIFSKEGGYCTYLWSIIKAFGSFVDFDLRVKDINALRVALANNDEDVTIKMSKADSRVRKLEVSGQRFSYLFFISDTVVPTTLSDMLSDFEKIFRSSR